MEHFKLAVENMKRNGRFQAGLTAEQVSNLAQQVEPIGEALASLRSKVKAIRGDARLSDSGKTTDTSTVKAETATRINDIAQQISKHAVISDLSQRIHTKVAGSRERAQKAMGADAALLAQELRLHILPRVLNDARQQQIPGHQALAKMVLRAAENYATDPTKAEIILAACTTGWPWVQADLTPETMQETSALIAQQVAAEEQAALVQAQQVQSLLNKVAESAQQEVRSQR